jgi:predicted ABC-type ATPase
MTSKPKPILTIVRGLPGSGKSTYARNLADETGAMILEPDALLVVGGEYCYNQRLFNVACDFSLELLQKIGEAGADAIYADVLARRAYVRDVIHAYRNGNRRSFHHSETGFSIAVIDMPLLTVDESMARNRHHVRREDIEHMAATWEPWEEMVK